MEEKNVKMSEESKRLEELLSLVFQTQAEAGRALGASQGTVARWINVAIPSNFRDKYGPRLAAHGLNVGYLYDPKSPQRLFSDAFEAIADEIQTLQSRTADVERRIKSLKTAAQ